MRVARSIVNALFFFVLFLFAYALVTPGLVSGATHGPRFLRMTVEDQEGRHGRPEKVSFCIPYGLIRGGLKFASLGRLHRELDLCLTDSVEADQLRSIWKELSESPDGTEVVRKRDFDEIRLKKEGGTVTVVQTKDCCPDEQATIRIPVRLLEAVAAHGRSFDTDAILSELRNLDRGELLDVKARDAHVRVWIE
ncbi:MAG: hypothetical protein ACM3JH_02690 [Acidithiobacillales bacterium]